MFEVQCLNAKGELVYEDKFDGILNLRCYTERDMVTQLARGEISTILINQDLTEPSCMQNT